MTMKKERVFLVFVFALIFMLCLSFTSSLTISKGNNTIADKYRPGENLAGNINISMSDVPFNTLVSAFDSSISLKDFLNNASVNYNCSNANCEMDYAISSGDNANSFTLNAGASKTIGLKLVEPDLTDISSFIINITSNTEESCKSPLILDILDDGSLVWNSNVAGSTFCGSGLYGCYKSAEGTLMAGTISADKSYCETIHVEPAEVFRVGADVSGTGAARFNMVAQDQSCVTPDISSSGTVSCELNLSITAPADIDVCLQQDLSSSAYNHPYQLYTESNSPCGYIGDSLVKADFSVFAQPKKYASLGTFSVGDADTASAVMSYIEEKYHGDCSRGCYLPIKLTSNIDNQPITINELSMKYNQGLKGNKTAYVLTSDPAKISIPKFTIMDISKAKLKVPTVAGQYPLSLTIGSELIARKTITILSLPSIIDLYPTEVPAGADIKFFATASGRNISSYKWNFGDNTTTIETLTNYATHKYSSGELRNYKITVSAKNNLGESNNSFTIKTISPKDYLSSLIVNYRVKINAIKAQINSYPAPVKEYINNLLNITSAEIELTQVQNDFNSSANASTSVYIGLLGNLYGIDLPEAVNVTQISSGKFVMDNSRVKLADVASATGEQISATEGSLQAAIFDWFLKNLDVNIEISTYSSINRNLTTPLLSYVKVNVKPVGTNVSNVYAVIALPKTAVSSLSASNPAYSEGSLSFPLDLSSGQKNFEFIVAGETNALEMPIYFTPSTSQLLLSLIIEPCNNNGVCEKANGETTANCRADCKPVGKTIFWLILLVILFLAAYIGLQEWYKKRYEDWLFKDKNDLFNLVSFMDNAEKQGLKKEDIFAKLKDKQWAFEQLSYAYKKFKGQRTGMFEIPVFTLLDKAKMLKTIDLKKKIGTEQKTAPEPRKSFVPNMPGKPSVIPFVNKNYMPAQPPVQQQNQKPKISGDNKQTTI